MEPIKGLYGAAVVTRNGATAFATASDPSYEEARFPVCSVSKQICAATILLLAEDGRLDLDEPVTRWYPDSPWAKVTLRHLLSHTSGLGHWRDAPGFDVFEPLDLDERIALFQRADLQHEPGRGWIYSSPGYVLVGDIARRASGTSYADLVTTRILQPLGMPATTVGHRPVGTPVAAGHLNGEPVPPRDHLCQLVGTGEIWSTPADIARFLTALPTVLSELSLRALHTVQAPLTEPGILTKHGYGLGVYIGELAGRPAYFHTGDNPGYVSFAGWLPEHEAAIVILGNDEALETEAVLTRLIPYATGV
jgi:CubicO group peptidase (beta-lactamase class C family)